MSFVFPLVCLGKPEGLSGVLSLQAVSVHGGWKLPLPPEPKPVLPQFPHKEMCIRDSDNRISAYIAQQGNCYVMNRRGTPSTLICIHKSDKGDNLDRYSNLAFVEIPIAKAILTESADEAKSLLKGYVLNSQQKKKPVSYTHLL